MKKIIGGVILLFILVLTGCSALYDIDEVVNEKYPLVDVVTSSAYSGDVSRVYRAENESIDDVVSYLRSQKEPNEVSQKVEGKQSLVYDDYFVVLTEDDEDPNDTVVEVATYGFVRENYHPSFFQGMFTYMLLDRLFDVDDWRSKQLRRCQRSITGNCYGGYTTIGGNYRGPSASPIKRGGAFRGGGPGAGK